MKISTTHNDYNPFPTAINDIDGIYTPKISKEQQPIHLKKQDQHKSKRSNNFKRKLVKNILSHSYNFLSCILSIFLSEQIVLSWTCKIWSTCDYLYIYFISLFLNQSMGITLWVVRVWAEIAYLVIASRSVYSFYNLVEIVKSLTLRVKVVDVGWELTEPL